MLLNSDKLRYSLLPPRRFDLVSFRVSEIDIPELGISILFYNRKGCGRRTDATVGEKRPFYVVFHPVPGPLLSLLTF